MAAGVPGLVFGGVVAPCGLRADLPSPEGGPLIDLPLAPLDREILGQEVDEDVIAPRFNLCHSDQACRSQVNRIRR